MKVQSAIPSLDVAAGHSANIPLIPMPTMSGFDMVRVKEITYCEGDGNCTRIHLMNGQTKLICKTLKELEKSLTRFLFHRIHASYLINLCYMSKYLKGVGGQVILNDGTTLNVAKGRKRAFIDRVNSAFS